MPLYGRGSATPSGKKRWLNFFSFLIFKNIFFILFPTVFVYIFFSSYTCFFFLHTAQLHIVVTSRIMFTTNEYVKCLFSSLHYYLLLFLLNKKLKLNLWYIYKKKTIEFTYITFTCIHWMSYLRPACLLLLITVWSGGARTGSNVA